MHALHQDTEAVRRMSPAEKLAVVHALIRQAFELKAAAVRARHPDLPEPEVRARAWEMVGGDPDLMGLFVEPLEGIASRT